MGVDYDAILKRMKDEFTLRSGYFPDDASDIGIRMKVVAEEIASSMRLLEDAKTNASVLTASGTALSKLAEERGMVRIPAEYAVGSLYFSRSTALATPVTIPENTVCAASATNPVRYITTAPATLAANATGVTVPARAQTAGKAGNIASQQVKAMITPPPSIEMVRNTEAFTGGRDAETDKELRERLLAAWIVFSNGSNAEFYRNCALEVPEVGSVGVVPRLNGAGTVGIYIVRKDGTTVDSTLLDKVRAVIEAKREISVNVTVAAATAVSCNYVAAIRPVTGITMTEAATICVAAFTEFFSKCRVGQSVPIKDVDALLIAIPQIASYTINRSVYTDVNIGQHQIAKKGSTSFTAL